MKLIIDTKTLQQRITKLQGKHRKSGKKTVLLNGKEYAATTLIEVTYYRKVINT